MKMYTDFDIYSRALIASKDVDPIYPFIKSLVKYKPDYNKYWFALVYVMFYSLESAIKFCEEIPAPEHWNESVFKKLRTSGHISKMGHERRGKQRTIENQIFMVDSFREYLESGDFALIALEDNRSFRNQVEKWPQHSGWASFKIAEVFEKALGAENLKVMDLGLEGRDPNSNDGPVGGLRWLYGRENEFDASIFSTWNNLGRKLAKNWKVDIGEVESALCKWHKLVSGKYYIGHDIEELCELRGTLGNSFNKIMDQFASRFWMNEAIHGVRKEYKAIYSEKQRIMNADFSPMLPKTDVFQLILNTD